tara:strand:+ start:2136 stop:2300 length:165 start_codon:yes stop_codon:yes gene_type:complete
MKKKDYLVYVPQDAKLNVENTRADIPKTYYDSRLKVFDRERVLRVLKGLRQKYE